MKDIFTIRKPSFKVILLGFFSTQSYRVFGSIISPLELIALIYFFYQTFFDVKNKVNLLFKNNVYLSISRLLLLWSSCQLISDIINQNSIRDSLKGVMSPLFILLTIRLLLVFYKYFKYNFFIEDLLLGYSLFQLYRGLFVVNSIVFALKMGGFIYLGLLIFTLFKNRSFKLIFSFLSIIASLILGIRMPIFIYSILIACNLFFKEEYINKINTGMFQNIFKGILKFFLIIFIILLSSPLYNSLNVLMIKVNPDESSSARLERQLQTNKGIFSARPEYLVFFSAFKDSPIIGHGSWARDQKYFFNKKRYALENQKKSERTLIREYCKGRVTENCAPLIPVHSFIQQTVIWAGIFSTGFIFYILNLNINIINKAKLDDSIKLIFINNFANILFTPLLGNHRGFLPIVCLALIISIISYNNKVMKLNSN